MSIKSTLEQAVKSLEQEKASKVAIVKERVTREIIVPYNREMDIARDKAIAEKQASLNANILAYQEQFNKEKQQLIDLGEKKKEEHATATITTEAYAVTVEYDKAIAKLHQQIADLKEE